MTLFENELTNPAELIKIDLPQLLELNIDNINTFIQDLTQQLINTISQYNNNTILLIDTSSLLYIHGNKSDYQKSLIGHICSMLERYNTKYFILFSENGQTNVRKQIDTNYKANRVKAADKRDEYLPYFKQVSEFVKTKLPIICYYNIENDDALRLSSNYIKENLINGIQYKCVICANDSDLLAIDSLHYNIKSQIETNVDTKLGTIELNNGKLTATGYFNTYSKILKGAAKENYKGLPGYGAVKTYHLLKDCKSELELQHVCIEHFYLNYGVELGLQNFELGFKLCYLLEKHKSFKFPIIRSVNDLVLN